MMMVVVKRCMQPAVYRNWKQKSRPPCHEQTGGDKGGLRAHPPPTAAYELYTCDSFSIVVVFGLREGIRKQLNTLYMVLLEIHRYIIQYVKPKLVYVSVLKNHISNPVVPETKTYESTWYYVVCYCCVYDADCCLFPSNIKKSGIPDIYIYKYTCRL